MEKNENDPQRDVLCQKLFAIGHRGHTDEQKAAALWMTTPLKDNSVVADARNNCGVNDVGVEIGGMDNGSASKGGTKENVGKHNNHAGVRDGTDNNDTKTMMLWTIGTCVMDNRSTDNINAENHVADHGGVHVAACVVHQ